MTSISTYYKSKYYPIGTGGARRRNPDVEARESMEALLDLSKVTEYYNKISAQAKTETLALSMGVAAAATAYRNLAANTVTVVREMSILHELEKSYIKTFKVSTTELINRRSAYVEIQKAFELTDKQMRQYMSSMEKFAPLHGRMFKNMADQTAKRKQNEYMEAQIAGYDALSKATGMSADQQAQFNLAAAGMGLPLSEAVALFSGISDKLSDNIDKSVVFETVTTEIASMSSDVRSQFKKYPGELSKAILMSNKLGVSFTDVYNIGKSLLDIEQSTGKELEYQLLSGKRLVSQGKSLTNAYRQATLSGNSAKMAGALNDILETQKDILEGENFYAKEALAQTLGMQTDKLMMMHEQKKLTDQIQSIAGADIKIDLKNLDDKKIEELKKSLNLSDSSDVLGELEKLRTSQQTQLTPADRIEQYLKSKEQTGLTVKLAPSQTAATFKEDLSGYAKTAVKPGQDLMDSKLDFQQKLGEYQIRAKQIDAFDKYLGEATGMLPVIGASLKKAIDYIDDKLKNVLAKPVEGITSTDATGGETAQKNNDAIIGINDGIIKFHEQDKLTVVASPFGSMNDRIAEKVTNPGNYASNSSIDTNSIVTAIQRGLSNMTVTVNVDPMAIHKEIQFKIG